jgi:hypothetical protein
MCNGFGMILFEIFEKRMNKVVAKTIRCMPQW